MADLDAIAGAARALLEPFLVEDPAARRDRVAAL